MNANLIGIIIGLAGIIAALPQAWGSDWRQVWGYHMQGRISWDVVHQTAIKLVSEMKRCDFSPDTIVGIGRGGVLAAGLVCSEIMGQAISTAFAGDGKAFCPAAIKLATINSTVVLKKSVASNSDSDVTSLKVERIDLSDLEVGKELLGGRTLLIVAQTFTGRTLEKAVQMLVNKGCPRDSILTASLFWHRVKVRPVPAPDIFGKQINVNKTVPWKSKGKSTDRF